MLMEIFDLHDRCIGQADTGSFGDVSIFAGRSAATRTSADYRGRVDRHGYVFDASGDEVGWVNLSDGCIYRTAYSIGNSPVAYVGTGGRVYAYTDYHGLLGDAGWRATVGTTDAEGFAAAAGYWFLLGGASGAVSRYDAVPSYLSEHEEVQGTSTEKEGHEPTYHGPGGGGGADLGGLGCFLGIGVFFVLQYLFQELGDGALFLFAAPLAIALAAEAISGAGSLGRDGLQSRLCVERIARALGIGFLTYVATGLMLIVLELVGCNRSLMAALWEPGRTGWTIEDSIGLAMGIIVAVGDFLKDE